MYCYRELFHYDPSSLFPLLWSCVETNEVEKQDTTNLLSTVQCTCLPSQVQKWTMHKDEMKKKASLKSQSSKMKQGSFTLECGRCRKVRVLGSQIRTIDSSHHVIIGNDLLDNEEVSIRYKDKPKNVDNVQFTGEIICNKCPVTRQNHLGTTLKYQEVSNSLRGWGGGSLVCLLPWTTCSVIQYVAGTNSSTLTRSFHWNNHAHDDR